MCKKAHMWRSGNPFASTNLTKPWMMYVAFMRSGRGMDVDILIFPDHVKIRRGHQEASFSSGRHGSHRKGKAPWKVLLVNER
jgi:hypothetical protein